MDSINTKSLLDHLTALEFAAQDLLEEKQTIVDMNRKQNQTRESRNAVQKVIKNNLHTDGNKTWVCYGNTFIKMKHHQVVKMLNESHSKLETDIKAGRDSLKVKLNTVRDIEGKSQAAGFDLKAMTRQEGIDLNELM